MTETVALLERLLDVIENDLAPLTRQRVALGNKIFGAAILRKSDLSLVVAETNDETDNPLWHGEMHAIKKFYELPKEGRPSTKDCIFLATHEPCSLCLSGITWSGFDNFYYLFSYEQTRDAFGIPHDIRILKEVYQVPDPDRDAVPADRPLYNRAERVLHRARHRAAHREPRSRQPGVAAGADRRPDRALRGPVRRLPGDEGQGGHSARLDARELEDVRAVELFRWR